MGLKSLLVAALAATASAATIDNSFWEECGTPEPSQEHMAMSAQMAKNESMQVAFGDVAQASINVPVYAHVVYNSKDTSGGYVTERNVRTQIDEMNSAYSTSSFQFSLQNISYTENESWSNNGDDMAMKRALRKGDYASLNLYFVATIEGTVVGRCYYPTNARPGSDTFYRDGCLVKASTTPHGTTAPHEVGHWLGLYHTFQGGCSEPGDHIDDTPACQKSRSCDEGTDTCPDLPGTDAVHNYMSYGRCRTEFSRGQKSRMVSSYNTYRA